MLNIWRFLALLHAKDGAVPWKFLATLHFTNHIQISGHKICSSAVSKSVEVKMPNFKLRSADGETFEVDVELAKCSTTIKTMVENLETDEKDEKVVPLSNVDSAILKKVIEWATHHKDDPPPLENDEDQKNSVDISPWDAEFFNEDYGTLLLLIVAAKYLDIKRLFEVACNRVENLIKNKTPEQIREIFLFLKDPFLMEFQKSEEDQEDRMM